MAIFGTITLEDLELVFTRGGNTVTYTVRDIPTGAAESRTVPAPEFHSALAIAMHNDGTPNWETDYPGAESVQPENPALRFIP